MARSKIDLSSNVNRTVRSPAPAPAGPPEQGCDARVMSAAGGGPGISGLIGTSLTGSRPEDVLVGDENDSALLVFTQTACPAAWNVQR
jgi:hypothetical protein